MSYLLSKPERWWRSPAGLVVHMAAAVAMAVGTASMTPAATPPAAVGSPDPSAERALIWIPFTSEAYTKAEQSGQPFVVNFGAEWCAPCKEMEVRTYRDPTVVDAARGIQFLHVDMTDADSYVSVVLKSFKVFGAPTTVFFGPDRKERSRRIGFIGPADYVRLLGESRAPGPASTAR